jgi:hypothetical protein
MISGSGIHLDYWLNGLPWTSRSSKVKKLFIIWPPEGPQDEIQNTEDVTNIMDIKYVDGPRGLLNK